MRMLGVFVRIVSMRSDVSSKILLSRPVLAYSADEGPPDGFAIRLRNKQILARIVSILLDRLLTDAYIVYEKGLMFAISYMLRLEGSFDDPQI